MKVGIVAGEKSGDYLGSELIKALKQQYPNAEFVGLCGPLMQRQGATTLADMDAISLFGLEGLLTAIPRILSIRKRLLKHFLASPPDVFIGIDVPDFNLTLERKLRANNILTVHYVSPTVWAWRSGRIKKIKRSADLMLTLFPFEIDFYRQHKMPAHYVGHPLAGQVINWQVDLDFKESLQIKDRTLVAILPGSRMSEVTRLAPEMLAAAYKLSDARPDLNFVIPAASEKIYRYLVNELKVDTNKVKLVNGHSRDLLQLADLAILASGTAALEAALFTTPMVVMYKVAWLSAAIFKRSITVEHFSMPNHLISPPIVPELIQSEATAENCVIEVTKLLDDLDYYQSMRSALSAIAPALHTDSGKLASEAIQQLIADKSNLAAAKLT